MVRRLCRLKQIYGVMYLVSRHRHGLRCFDEYIVSLNLAKVNMKSLNLVILEE